MKQNQKTVRFLTSAKGCRFLVWGLSVAMMTFAFPAQAEKAWGRVNDSNSQVVNQTRTVTGTVLDETGEPLIGVSVQVKGTSTGTITDFDGKFSLNVPANATLTVSYIGYQTQDIKVGSQRDLTVRLRPDNKLLDEVVVIGYGTVKKRDLTGAVASMKNADVVIAPTNNVMEALQGKVAGLDITKTSGQVGEDVEILLRGSRSIYGSNAPLFIIDGIPGSYSQINPSDIESVDVLKDASSTAIYGSAGANGVVIITTKRGKEGKATVNFDAYYGFSGDANYTHGMIGDEWVTYQREAYKYSHGDYPTDMASLFGNPDYLDAYNQGKWIDWVDKVSGNTATTQKYSLSVSGGNEKTKIFASTSYSKETGLLDNEQLEKYALRLNIDQEVFDWAKVGFTSNLTYQDRDQGVKNTFTKALTSFPLGDVYDDLGNIKHEYITGQYTPLGDFIPYQYANNTRSTYVNVNGYVELTPLKGLNFRSQLSATLSNSRQGQYWGDQASANLPSYASGNHASAKNAYAWGYTWENVLSYNRKIAEDHDFTLQGITSWSKTTNENNTAAGNNQQLDIWQWHRLLSTSNPYVYSEYSQTQKMSYALRFNYSYKGKYLFTFSNRWDGVSWFSDGDKWEAFPATALAWRISDEGFMENTKNWLSNLKLRVGYGITGNAGGMGAYATTTQAYYYTSGGVSKDGEIVSFAQYTGTYGGRITWEKSYNWNVGLDFGLFDNRLDGSLEWFSTETKGLLYQRTLPITSGNTGWGSPLKSWQNLAKTSNRGIEATINSHNMRSKDFTWDTTLSVTWSKEKIEELPEGDIIAESLFVGQPIKSIYGYKYAGLWNSATPQTTLDAYGVEPGFIKIETLPKEVDGVSDNGLHTYSEDDRQVLGHRNPDWVIGLNNTFAYKGFDLSVFAMARYGQTISSDLLGRYTGKSDDITTNQLAGVDYWTEENQGAYYPRPGSGNKQSLVYSALSVVDGSFIKIKNITLGYTLPKSLTQHALMEKCRFYVTAYNPFIFAKDSKLKDTDPETGGSDAFPTYKQFVFGVNITF